jgi:flavorubredoxin
VTTKKVMVIYHSHSGNTEACAELVAQGVREAGDLDVIKVNMDQAQRIDMRELAACDGLAIGSPDYASYVAGTIKQLFDDLYIAKRDGIPVAGKPCVLFVTHGGGGRAAELMERLAGRYGGLTVLGEVFSCLRAPEEGCPDAIALGKTLGTHVLGQA